MTMLNLPHPCLLFLGDTREGGHAQSASGLRDWAGEKCVGELACAPGVVSLGLPVADPIHAGEPFEALVDHCQQVTRR